MAAGEEDSQQERKEKMKQEYQGWSWQTISDLDSMIYLKDLCDNFQRETCVKSSFCYKFQTTSDFGKEYFPKCKHIKARIDIEEGGE